MLKEKIWLRWHPDSIHQKWLAKATIDIHFDQVTRESQAKNNIHPVRINSWQQVSPLESLAGARPTDDVQDEVLQDPLIRSWLEDNSTDYHAKRFLALKSLLSLVEKQVLFPLRYVPPNWKGENEEVAAQQRDRTGLATLLEGLKAWRTLLPRRASRELLRVFQQQEATMIDYQSAMIGGEIPGIVPLPPSSVI